MQQRKQKRKLCHLLDILENWLLATIMNLRQKKNAINFLIPSSWLDEFLYSKLSLFPTTSIERFYLLEPVNRAFIFLNQFPPLKYQLTDISEVETCLSWGPDNQDIFLLVTVRKITQILNQILCCNGEEYLQKLFVLFSASLWGDRSWQPLVSWRKK